MKGNVYGVDGSGDVRDFYETLLLMGTSSWKQRRGSRSVLGELDRTASRAMPFGSRPGTKGGHAGRRSMCCRESVGRTTGENVRGKQVAK